MLTKKNEDFVGEESNEARLIRAGERKEGRKKEEKKKGRAVFLVKHD